MEARQLISILTLNRAINNYFSIASALFMAFLVPVWIPLVVMFCLKFVGGVFVRFCLKTFYKKDFQNA